MNKIHIQRVSKGLGNHYILLDNDFLSHMFEYEDFLMKVLSEFEDNYFLLDDFVKVEFLTSPLDEKVLSNKEAFLQIHLERDIITPAPNINQADSWLRYTKDILILRKVYYYYGILEGVSVVDLTLLSRLMSLPNASLLTGNIKHFSSPFLDCNSVLTFVFQKKHSNSSKIEIRNFYEVSLNKKKLIEEYGKYGEVIKRGLRGL